jgi:hypothetical protein
MKNTAKMMFSALVMIMASACGQPVDDITGFYKGDSIATYTFSNGTSDTAVFPQYVTVIVPKEDSPNEFYISLKFACPIEGELENGEVEISSTTCTDENSTFIYSGSGELNEDGDLELTINFDVTTTSNGQSSKFTGVENINVEREEL